jgi:hypothetical protein
MLNSLQGSALYVLDVRCLCSIQVSFAVDFITQATLIAFLTNEAMPAINISLPAFSGLHFYSKLQKVRSSLILLFS